MSKLSFGKIMKAGKTADSYIDSVYDYIEKLYRNKYGDWE